jgi:YHS domain-containing protein
MTYRIRAAAVAAIVGGAAAVAVVGCQDKSDPTPNVAAASSPAAKHTPVGKHDHDHEHGAGAHGGLIVSIGQDNYHTEAVFEKGGVLRLFMLGKDESKVMEVPSQTLTAYAKAEGATEAEQFNLEPKPQPGDKQGMTSVFVGNLPKGLAGKTVEVTIPSITIGGERFRIAFKSASVADAGHGMPDKVADAEERTLYLTPGGKYTAADIAANGNRTASEKFKGVKAEHDLKPKPGDKVCPVTMTKANPKFSWVIGGKTYEFCCPPCVDEFVSLAKENPDELKEPDAYRKK